MFKLLAFIVSRLQRFCLTILKSGQVPKHLAFIMDGNRRYAVKQDISVYEGTKIGFGYKQTVEQWCLFMGIQEITVYLFSVYNYSRSINEIFAVFALVREILEDDSYTRKYGIRYRIVGNLALLPVSMRRVCARVMLRTQHNKNLTVNVALSYASRDEITNSVKCIVDGVDNQLINTDDINEQLITDCLYTNECADVDMIIRSSGETRLSDYMTWQSITACLLFIKPCFPELSFSDFCSMILLYQKHYKQLTSIKNETAHLEPKHSESNQRVQPFLNHLKELRQRRNEIWAAL